MKKVALPKREQNFKMKRFIGVIIFIALFGFDLQSQTEKDSSLIFFDRNSSKLSEDSKLKLNKLVEEYLYLKEDILRGCVILLGDKSCVEEKKSNKNIGFQRYFAIIDYCESLGVINFNFLMQDGRKSPLNIHCGTGNDVKGRIYVSIICDGKIQR